MTDFCVPVFDYFDIVSLISKLSIVSKIVSAIGPGGISFWSLLT